MKILFCNYEYPPLGGGGGVINAMLAEYLAANHEVTVITSSGLELPESETVNGVRVVRVPVYFRRDKASANLPSMAAFMINGIRRGLLLLKNETFDIINTHFALPSGPVGHALSRFSGVPNVLSVHGGDLYDPSKFSSPHRHWFLRLWVTHLLRKADLLVGQSENTIANVGKYYDTMLDVECVPLGINRPVEFEVSRSELNLADDDFVLVTVGRLVSRKGVDKLLRILSRASIDKLKLVVIGSGPLEQELKGLARSLGLEKSVVFTGFVEENIKQKLLVASDVYVSSSQHEGFGLVFLEAMSASLPVVCYNHGGQSDFLEHGATGALIDLNDESGFIESLQNLYADVKARARIGRYNLKKVESYYIDNCAERYESLFRSLLKNKALDLMQQ